MPTDPNTTLTTPAYDQLKTDLTAILQKGQQDAMNAVNEIRVTTYWQMGQRLAAEKDLLDSADSGAFITQLSTDLGLEQSIIYRILQFFRTYPDGIPKLTDANTLSWAHFTELLAIKDATERDFYFEQASKEGWSRNTLRKAISSDLYASSQDPTTTTNTKLERSNDPLHTYKAIVEKVVDGDTLEARIDLGFNVWVAQRIRFRGINTAEMKAGGEPAKLYVEEKLNDIPFIVIKTYKTDMYGRYVADVFYHPTIKTKEDIALKGFFLNEEILKAGLAEIML